MSLNVECRVDNRNYLLQSQWSKCFHSRLRNPNFIQSAASDSDPSSVQWPWWLYLAYRARILRRNSSTNCCYIRLHFGLFYINSEYNFNSFTLSYIYSIPQHKIYIKNRTRNKILTFVGLCLRTPFRCVLFYYFMNVGDLIYRTQTFVTISPIEIHIKWVLFCMATMWWQ